MDARAAFAPEVRSAWEEAVAKNGLFAKDAANPASFFVSIAKNRYTFCSHNWIVIG